MDEHIQAARAEIKAFLDEQGRLKALPSKRKKALAAVYYAGSKLEAGQDVSVAFIGDSITCGGAAARAVQLRPAQPHCRRAEILVGGRNPVLRRFHGQAPVIFRVPFKPFPVLKKELALPAFRCYTWEQGNEVLPRGNPKPLKN